MRGFYITFTLLPYLVLSSPVPGILLTKDGGTNIVVRNAIPEANPEISTLLPNSELEKRQAADTANDLVNGICRAVTVIFARGTTESGNIGLLVGPPLRNALNADLGSSKVAFQGVDYPADIAGFLVGGSPSGASTMASLANRAATQCPQTQIVLSGYSQGAQVVSRAAAQLPTSTTSRIKAVVLFGNPNDHDPVPNISADKLLIICHVGDLICARQDIVLPPHLTYGIDTPTAASFIQSKVSV